MYSKHRSVSLSAVQRAIESGRLEKSVVMIKGAPKISDADLADREWEANTQPRVDYVVEPVVIPEGIPDYHVSRARREAAAARREFAMAELTEIEVRERRGELVAASEVAAKFTEVVTVAKTKLLGLAARIKQRAPHIVAGDLEMIDSLVREALEGLANGG